MAIVLFKPFQKKKKSKKKMKRVSPVIPSHLKEIQRDLKEFIPHLTAVQEKNGKCIKMLFG